MQEITVQTNSYAAEAECTAGGVVQQTRSNKFKARRVFEVQKRHPLGTTPYVSPQNTTSSPRDFDKRPQ